MIQKDHRLIRVYFMRCFAGVLLAVLVLFVGCGDSRVPKMTSLAEESVSIAVPDIQMPTADSTSPAQSVQKAEGLEWAFPPTYKWEDVNAMRELDEDDIGSEYGFAWSWRENDEAFDYTAADYNSLAFFQENERWGVVNQAGEIVVPSSYNARLCVCNLTNEEHDAFFTPDGTVLNMLGGHGGPAQLYYDENNHYLVMLGYGGVFPANFEETGLHAVLLAPVCNIPESYGPEGIDETDFSLPEEELQYAVIRYNGADVTLDSQEKYLNFAENITRAEWDWHGAMGNSIAELTTPTAVQMLDGNWKFLDADGYELPIGTFENAWSFSEDGIAAVKREGMWGYIDIEGRILVPFVLEDAARAYGGKAWAKIDGLWGVLDVKGDFTENADA